MSAILVYFMLTSMRLTPPLTPFFPIFPFDAPENTRKSKVFGCFQGDKKGTSGRKEIKQNKHFALN